jgi:putative transcriptional regulator
MNHSKIARSISLSKYAISWTDNHKRVYRIKRAANKISQDDLAKLVGVSRQTINAIENNKYYPSLELGLKLSKILKCSVNELFSLDDE